LTIFKHNSFTR